jgi:hypothetical protein
MFAMADFAFMVASLGEFYDCCLRSALQVERRVNSSDSRGMLSTKG